MLNNDVAIVILTKNESVNIERCIKSLKCLSCRIIVVDSGSDDGTGEIAASLGADVFNHVPFDNHGKQFNWAVDNIAIDSPWLFRIDADEVVPEALAEEILLECHNHLDDDVNAFEMRFKVFFLGKFLRHGGAYPFCKINIFKKDKARFSERPLGDNVELYEGRYIQLKNDCLHYDFKNLSSFIRKHDWYADLEVQSYYSKLDSLDNNISAAAALRKNLRSGLYYKLPKYFRAKLYYWFNYYLRLGFLDGEAGRVYAFLQAYFFRFVVDAKIHEQEIMNENTAIGGVKT